MRIKLGSKVKDKVTGFTGIATQRIEYLQGCYRIGIQSQKLNKDGEVTEAYYVDEPQIEVIKEDAITSGDKEIEEKTGGAAYGLPKSRSHSF